MNASSSESDHERLGRFARASFMRSGKTVWPTVRQASLALKWSQYRVTDAVEGDPKSLLSMTGNGEEGRDGADLFIEVVIVASAHSPSAVMP